MGARYSSPAAKVCKKELFHKHAVRRKKALALLVDLTAFRPRECMAVVNSRNALACLIRTAAVSRNDDARYAVRVLCHLLAEDHAGPYIKNHRNVVPRSGAVTALLVAMKHAPEGARVHAARALGLMGIPSDNKQLLTPAIPELVRYLTPTVASVAVNVECAIALAHINTDYRINVALTLRADAVPKLVKMLKRRDPESRAAAGRALGAVCEDSASVRRAVYEAKGIPALAALLSGRRLVPEKEGVVNALAGLCHTKDLDCSHYRRELQRLGGLEAVVAMLPSPSSTPTIISSACRILEAFAYSSSKNRKLLTRYDVPARLSHVIERVFRSDVDSPVFAVVHRALAVLAELGREKSLQPALYALDVTASLIAALPRKDLYPDHLFTVITGVLLRVSNHDDVKDDIGERCLAPLLMWCREAVDPTCREHAAGTIRNLVFKFVRNKRRLVAIPNAILTLAHLLTHATPMAAHFAAGTFMALGIDTPCRNVVVAYELSIPSLVSTLVNSTISEETHAASVAALWNIAFKSKSYQRDLIRQPDLLPSLVRLITQGRDRAKQQALGCLSCLTPHRGFAIDCAGMGLVPWLVHILYDDSERLAELAALCLATLVKHKDLVETIIMANTFNAVLYLVEVGTEAARLYGGRILKKITLRHKVWKGIETVGPKHVRGTHPQGEPPPPVPI